MLDEKTSSKRKMAEGFSLIEVLVAVGILALSILSIMTIFPQGISYVTRAGRVSTINHLGQEKMDQLRGLSYTANDLLQGSHPSTGLGDPDDVETNDDWSEVPSGYSRTWTVTAEGNPDTNMKTVVIVVGYKLYDDTGTALAADFNNVKNQDSTRFQMYIAR